MNPQPFRVVIPKFPADELRDIFRSCATGEERREIVESARIIERGLRWFADELGESRYRLNKLGEMRLATLGTLGVYFVVDTTRRIVNVARFYRIERRKQ